MSEGRERKEGGEEEQRGESIDAGELHGARCATFKRSIEK